MRNELIEKGSRFRELKTQYEAFVMEHHFVTDQVISSATTARLEEIDLGILHWEGLNQDEINAFGGMDIFTTPSWPGVPPSTGAWPAAGAGHWREASLGPCRRNEKSAPNSQNP
jgi:hypothetical protein